MNLRQDRLALAGVIVAVAGVVGTYLGWLYPNVGARTRTPLGAPPVPVSSRSESSGMHDASWGSLSEEEDGRREKARGPVRLPGYGKSIESCGVREILTLQPGAPARVASGLAVLSVTPARLGSEAYLTLGIASDRETLGKAVAGAPMRFRFLTSRGAYVVNVTDVDLASGATTLQVGCDAKENTR